MSHTRWIFRKANRIYRYIAIVSTLLFSTVCYFVYGNIFFGTFLLFIFSYLLGAFKGRRRIEVIQNQSIDSAITELCKLIDSSLGNVYILSRSLNPKIYNQVDVLHSLNAAKHRGVTIKIISERDKTMDAHRHCFSQSGITGILKLVEERRLELFSIDKDLDNTNHFAVVDNISFRLEQKHGIEDERKAIIVYRNKKARTLQTAFENLLAQPSVTRVPSTEIVKLLRTANELEAVS
jgi:hypothetical protein